MIKHANFQAVEYVIVTGGNGQVRKKGLRPWIFLQ